MNNRSRIPNLFSLSMVDVLCCALGCVILLWLLHSREAQQNAELAEKNRKALEQTSENLDSKSGLLDKSRSELEALSEKYRETLAALGKSNDTVSRLEAELGDALKKNKTLLATLNLKDEDLTKLNQKLTLNSKQYAALEKALKDTNDNLAREKVLTDELLAKLLTADTLALLLNSKLLVSNKNLSTLTNQIGDSGKQLQIVTTKLDATDKENLKLLDQLKDADKLRKQLEQLLENFKQEAKDNATKLDKTQTQALVLSKEMDKKNQDLKKKDEDLVKNKVKLDDLLRELEEVAKLKKALEFQLALNQQDLSKAQASISGLQKDKKDLVLKADLFKTAWANRFEGIELTGKRVVFVVDISGSMGRVDTNTLAPGKWGEVCGLLAKLMKSLPDLTHYQVVAFSDKVSYPLDYEGKWLVYDPKTSPDYLMSKMKKLEPTGGTNIYPAFAEAFKYKPGGLDTIYFISDGLPDPAEIPASVQNLPKAEQTSYFCNQIRQQLKKVWNPPVNDQTAVRINTIGFFFESPDVGAFLWALARENNGNFVGMSRP